MLLARYLAMSLAWWLGLVFAAVGVAFIVGGIAAWKTENEFRASAVPATAIVVDKGTEERPNDEIGHWLRYEYGQDPRHSGKTYVSVEEWDRTAAGRVLEIEYLPHEPDRSRVRRERSDASWLWLSAFGLPFAVAGSIVAVRALRTEWRRTRLLQTGTAHRGRVVLFETNQRVKVNNRPTTLLLYEFTDARGRRHEGKSLSLSRRMASRFGVGDEVVVVQDPSDPSRHEIDLFGCRNAGG